VYLEALSPAIKSASRCGIKTGLLLANHRNDLLNLLFDLNIGTVISDTSGRRDCAHMDLTTTDAIIRFVGNNLADSDFKRLDEREERLKEWSAQGLRSVRFSCTRITKGMYPKHVSYIINQLNAKLSTSIGAPKLISD
jgi:hypothetical protein